MQIYLSFTIAVILVTIFGYFKFKEDAGSLSDAYKSRIFSQFYMGDLADRQQFIKYNIFYVCVLLILFSAIYLVGPKVVEFPKSDAISSVAWPVVAALAIIGLLPMPGFVAFDTRFRAICQSSVSIVTTAELIRSKIQGFEQLYGNLSKSTLDRVFVKREIRAAFEGGNLTNTPNNWIYASILLAQIDHCLDDYELQARIGGELINKYKPVLNQIRELQSGIAEQIGLSESASVEAYTTKLERANLSVNRFYDDIFTFCGCAIALRNQGITEIEAFQALNFKVPEALRQKRRYEIEVSREQDTFITACFIGFIASVIVYFIFSVLPSKWMPMEFYKWPSLYNRDINLPPFALDIVWIIGNLYFFFRARKRQFLSGHWFRRLPIDGSVQVAPSAYVVPSLKMIATATLTLAAVTMLMALSGDADCSVIFSTDCLNAVQKPFPNFFKFEWMKIAWLIFLVIVFFAVVDYAYVARENVYLFFGKLITFCLLFGFAYVYYFYGYELDHQGNDRFRLGHVVAYSAALMVFVVAAATYYWWKARGFNEPA